MNNIVLKFLTLRNHEFEAFIYGPDFEPILRSVARVVAPRQEQQFLFTPDDIPYFFNRACNENQKSLRSNLDNPNWHMTESGLRNYICKTAKRIRNSEYRKFAKIVEMKPIIESINDIINWKIFLKSLYNNKPAFAYARGLILQRVEKETFEFLEKQGLNPSREYRENIISALNDIIECPYALFPNGKIHPSLGGYLDLVPDESRKSLKSSQPGRKALQVASRHILDILFTEIKSFQRWRRIQFEELSDTRIHHSSLSAEEEALRKINREDFWKAFRKSLAEIAVKCPKRKLVLEAEFVHSMPQNEIAFLLEISPGAVRQAVFKGKISLKELLLKNGIGPDFFS